MRRIFSTIVLGAVLASCSPDGGSNGALPTSVISASSDETTSTTGSEDAHDDTHPNASCELAGVDSFGDIQIRLLYSSDASSPGDLELDYELIDPDGASITVGSSYHELVQPGEAIRQEYDTITPMPAGAAPDEVTCRVVDVTTTEPSGELITPADDNVCEYTGVDFASDMQVRLSFTNELPDAAGQFVKYALRDPTGIRIGESIAVVDTADPGETVVITDDTLTTRPDGLSDDEISYDILGYQALS